MGFLAGRKRKTVRKRKVGGKKKKGAAKIGGKIAGSRKRPHCSKCGRVGHNKLSHLKGGRMYGK